MICEDIAADPLWERYRAFALKHGLRATLTAQRTFNNVNLTTVVDAEGRGLDGQSQLKISAELFRTTSGESYVIGVDTILRGVTEQALKVQARLERQGIRVILTRPRTSSAACRNTRTAR